jgi:hypothetical protein
MGETVTFGKWLLFGFPFALTLLLGLLENAGSDVPGRKR